MASIRMRVVMGLAGTLGLGAVHAQQAYEWDSYEKRIASKQSVVALGSDLFGESVNLQNGGLSFTVTDVDLPGNNALPVRFTRSYSVRNSREELFNDPLADWTVQVPRLSGRFATDWLAGDSTERCSNTIDLPKVPAYNAAHFSLSSFWQGVQLDLPGGGGELLVSAPGISKPAPVEGQPYRWTTTDGQTHLRCISSIRNGPGEGFVAVTPDGTQYTFDWMAQRPDTGLYVPGKDPAGAQDPQGPLVVRENSLYATRVTDRFGNWVSYTYTNGSNVPNAWNEPARLTQIVANDGRQIDIEYTDARFPLRISAVKAGSTTTPKTKTWSYSYDLDDHHNQDYRRNILRYVTLPDLTQWDIQFASLSYSPIIYDTSGEAGSSCNSAPTPQNGFLTVNDGPVELVGTLVHPSGASGTFKLSLEEHGRSHVTLSCARYTTTPTGATPGTGNDPNDDVSLFPISYNAWSITEKSISGPGLSPQTWRYSYIPNASSHTFPGTEQTLLCNWPECYRPIYISDDEAGQSQTTVIAPDGSFDRYIFGTSWQYNEGKLIRVERSDVLLNNNILLETVSHCYDLSRTYDGQTTPGTASIYPLNPCYNLNSSAYAYPARYGQSRRENSDGFESQYHRPKIKTITSRKYGGTAIDKFTWAVDPCVSLGFSRCLDGYARPTRVTKSSNLGAASHGKQETYGYEDQPSNWILGLPLFMTVRETATAGATETARASYDQTTGQMLTFSAFGQLQQTMTYNTNGTVATVEDGNQRITTLSNWSRGVPTTITYADQTTESATVNDFGWITHSTDELGHQTKYDHDGMGRVTSVTHLNNVTPVGHDTVANVTWSPTSITYARVPSATAQFGIEANHWKRTETTGTRVRETYYDTLWRPVLERSRDTDSSTRDRFVRRQFDHAGRQTFLSYPKALVPGNDYAQLTEGVTTTYNALGQVRTQVAHSELGPLQTMTNYLAPFSIEVINPRGQTTTTTYRAFDEPTYDQPMTISAPAGVTTAFIRDIFGKPVTMTRSGTYTTPENTSESLSIPRRYVYDAQQRLCKTIEPDAGITVMGYDAANNLSWRATGQNTLTSQTLCQAAPASKRSALVYDARNRLLAIDHPGSTADVGYTYFADGAVRTATTGTATVPAATPPAISTVSWSPKLSEWTYTYNKRRLLESESLAVDSKVFALDWSYNARGDVTSLVYPSGQSVAFNPNAYGEPQQAGSVATGAAYYPNGALSGFNYGNGIQRDVQLNARQLPLTIRDTKSGAPTLFDHSLTYDENANLESLVDGTTGAAETRQLLGYDGLDRLTSVALSTKGNETYAYDPLDNLRQTVIKGIDRRYHYDAKQRLERIATAPTAPTANSTQLIYGWNGRGEMSLKGDYTTLPGREQRFVFDDAARLIQATGTECYRYDAHGHRVLSDRCGTGSKRYQVYSKSGQMLYVEDSGDAQHTAERVEYVYLGKTLVAERNPDTAVATYQHSDHRGTPSAESNQSAGLASPKVLLMPFGSPYDGAGVLRDGPGFTGHATDKSTGLSYMQQRYYDPVAGRFLSPDPVASGAGSFNRYWYANNNPYTLVDPDGRESTHMLNVVMSDWAGATQRGERAVNLTADFTPGVGDVKGFVDAYNDPSLANVAAAVVGLGGPLGDAAAKVIKGADNIADAVSLNKALASEAQTTKILAGQGEAIAGAGTDVALRDSPRLAAQHGGDAGDWSKVSGGNHVAPDGTKIETHGYENKSTGQVVELKTKLIDEKK